MLKYSEFHIQEFRDLKKILIFTDFLEFLAKKNVARLTYTHIICDFLKLKLRHLQMEVVDVPIDQSQLITLVNDIIS